MSDGHASRPRPQGSLERAARYALFRGERLGRGLSQTGGRALVRSAGAPSLPVPSFTNQAELATLARLALTSPRGAAGLEIGSYLGASTRYLAAGLSHGGARLYCVDTWRNQTMPEGPRDTLEAFKANLGPLMAWVVPIRKPSQELVPRDIPEPIGLAFIDGDHSDEAIRSDVRRALPTLRSDATIAFHDCGTFRGVGRAIGELLCGGDWVIAGMVDTLVWLRRGRWDASGRAVWSKTE